jgi:hypothetical protein
VNKHTPRNLAISRVFFSCFGSMKMGHSAVGSGQISIRVDRIVLDRFSLPLFWHILAALLVRRATPDKGAVPKQPD